MFVLLGNDLTPSFRSEFQDWANENTWANLAILPAKLGVYLRGEPNIQLFSDTAKPHFSPEEVTQNLAVLKDQPVAIVQSTGPPVSEHIMQLLLAIRTLKRYGAGPITVIMPFAAFGRQDRSMTDQFNSVAAQDFAHMLREAGASAVITAEVHSKAAEKAYTDVFGVHNVSFVSFAELFAKDIVKQMPELKDLAIGAPDGGDKPQDAATLRAGAVNEAVSRLGGRNALCEEFRIWKSHTDVSKTQVDNFEGNVASKTCALIDDMTDTGGTMENGATAVKFQGGAWITWAYLAHNLTDAHALGKLLTATVEGPYGPEPLFNRIVTTDTVPIQSQYINDLAQNGLYWDSLKHRLTVLHTAETFARRLVLMNP